MIDRLVHPFTRGLQRNACSKKLKIRNQLDINNLTIKNKKNYVFISKPNRSDYWFMLLFMISALHNLLCLTKTLRFSVLWHNYFPIHLVVKCDNFLSIIRKLWFCTFCSLFMLKADTKHDTSVTYNNNSGRITMLLYWGLLI